VSSIVDELNEEMEEIQERETPFELDVTIPSFGPRPEVRAGRTLSKEEALGVERELRESAFLREQTRKLPDWILRPAYENPWILDRAGSFLAALPKRISFLQGIASGIKQRAPGALTENLRDLLRGTRRDIVNLGLLQTVGVPLGGKEQEELEAAMKDSFLGGKVQEAIDALDDLIARHPEWKAPQLERLSDLLRKPKVLGSAIADMGVYMGASGFAKAVGGTPLAFGVIYEMLGEDSRKRALNEGAPVWKAELNKLIDGGIQTLIELAQLKGIGRLLTGDEVSRISKLARQSVWRRIRNGGLMQGVWEVLRNGVEEALQQVSQETVPILTGTEEEIRPGFLTRVVGSGVAGLGFATGFGLAGAGARSLLKGLGTSIGDVKISEEMMIPEANVDLGKLNVLGNVLDETWKAPSATPEHFMSTVLKEDLNNQEVLRDLSAQVESLANTRTYVSGEPNLWLKELSQKLKERALHLESSSTPIEESLDREIEKIRAQREEDTRKFYELRDRKKKADLEGLKKKLRLGMSAREQLDLALEGKDLTRGDLSDRLENIGFGNFVKDLPAWVGVENLKVKRREPLKLSALYQSEQFRLYPGLEGLREVSHRLWSSLSSSSKKALGSILSEVKLEDVVSDEALKARLREFQAKNPSKVPEEIFSLALEKSLGMGREIKLPQQEMFSSIMNMKGLPSIRYKNGEIILKEGKLPKTPREIKSPWEEEVSQKLQERIQETVEERGISKKALEEIKRKFTGQTKLDEMSVDSLKGLLVAVSKARPKGIFRKGKILRPITPDLERRILTYKANLESRGLLSEAAWGKVLVRASRGKPPGFRSKKDFTTQKEGFEILRQLHKEEELLKYSGRFEAAIQRTPQIREIVDDIRRRRAGKPKFSLAKSFRYYIQDLGRICGEKLYHAYHALLETHNEVEYLRTQVLEELRSLPGYERIRKDPDALQRISDWIASQSEREDAPKPPEKISQEEIALAKNIQEILRSYEWKARLAEFLDLQERKKRVEEHRQYKKYQEQLDEAQRVYDTEGVDALPELLKKQSWGVITKGYDPRRTVIWRISEDPVDPDPLLTGLGDKTHIKPRRKGFVRQEKNILQRLISYMRKMDALSLERPRFSALVELLNRNMDSFKRPDEVVNVMRDFSRNLRGVVIDRGIVTKTLKRLYGQAITTRVLASPWHILRNSLQNPAFYQDKKWLAKEGWKRLDERALRYFDSQVDKHRQLMEYWAWSEEKPIWGTGWLVDFVRKYSPYPKTDWRNRIVSFTARLGQLRHEWNRSKDLKTFLKRIGFSELQPDEQELALGKLAADGRDEFFYYLAKVRTDNTHFLYSRFERSPVEQSPFGYYFFNLFLFGRAASEKMLLQMKNAVQKGATLETRIRAAKNIVSIAAGSWVCSEILRKLSGRRSGAYSFFNFLDFSLGGLMGGIVDLANTTWHSMFMALQGDSRALGVFLSNLPKLGDYLVPFYDIGFRLFEGFMGRGALDLEALRRIRELIDREYKRRGGVNKVERTWYETFQYVFGGPSIDYQKRKERARMRKAAKAFKKVTSY